MKPADATHIAFDILVEYWLGELDQGAEAAVEEHLLGCGACADDAQQLAELARGIRALVRNGAVYTAVTGAFVARLAARGLRLRESRVPRDGSVHCTVAPDDDLLISRLQGPLENIERLDALLIDPTGQHRLHDIPFNGATGEVVFVPAMASIRAAGAFSARIQLLAVARESERLVGEYTFVHSPWPGA